MKKCQRAHRIKRKEKKKKKFSSCETHSKKKREEENKNLLFGCVFVFFLPPRASTNFDEFLFRVFHQSRAFFFSFFQPTWQKKDTRIHAHQNHRNNKSKEGHAREVKKKSAFVRFHPFLRRVSDS